MSEPSTSITKCEICHVDAHGTHFGVISCRACAAFFRRTIVKKREKLYECRKGKGNCEIRPLDRFHCRQCRFKKCMSLGMTSNNVQLYRDSFPSTRNTRPKVTTLKTRGVPLQMSSKRIVDVSNTRADICRILDDREIFTVPIFRTLNKLEQAEFGLRKWRLQQKPEKYMKVLKSVNIFDLFKTFQKLMLVVARWLSYMEDFQKFTTDQKYQFFKLVWNILRRFERYEMSLEMFGEQAITEDKFALTNDCLVSAELTLDFSQVSTESNEKMRKCFRDAWISEFRKVAKTLIDLQPTSTEMAFMLSELSWQIAGKEMQGKVLEVSEKVRDELGSNLHSYYQNWENLPNYAGRLIKLTKVVNSIMKSHGELKKRMELAHIFDVFNVELSERDLYDC